MNVADMIDFQAVLVIVLAYLAGLWSAGRIYRRALALWQQVHPCQCDRCKIRRLRGQR